MDNHEWKKQLLSNWRYQGKELYASISRVLGKYHHLDNVDNIAGEEDLRSKLSEYRGHLKFVISMKSKVLWHDIKDRMFEAEQQFGTLIRLIENDIDLIEDKLDSIESSKQTEKENKKWLIGIIIGTIIGIIGFLL